jgi:hypothetical protein
LYYTHGDDDSGEYLVINGPSGRTTGKIGSLPEWAHWSRTSLYLTEDRKIAVLGTAYSDYIVNLSDLTIKNLTGRVASARTHTLGLPDHKAVAKGVRA